MEAEEVVYVWLSVYPYITTLYQPLDLVVAFLLIFQIQVGVMENGRVLRGSRVTIETIETSSAIDILTRALFQMRKHNANFIDGQYTLCYPNGCEVITLPGDERLFRLNDYKEDLLKEYTRIIFYVQRNETGYIHNCLIV